MSTAMLAALLDEAAHGFIAVDGEARIADANGTFATWTGRSLAELRSTRFDEHLAPASRIYFETHILPQLRLSSEVNEVAVDLLCGGKGRMPVLLSARVHDQDGGPLLSFTVMSVPERRSYERELLLERRRAEEALKELHVAQARLLAVSRNAAQNVAATSLAHELNQPLTVCAAQIALLAHLTRLDVADDRVTNALSAAAESVTKASALVKRMRRITEPAADLSRSITAAALVESACNLVMREEEHGRTNIASAADLPVIVSRDPNQLAYALGEVILNALEATAHQEGGRVWISAAAINDGLMLSVEDNGSGPPTSEDHFAIGTSSKEGHRGLGLTIARTIIEADRGKIQLKHRAGQGCIVQIELPAMRIK